MSNPDCSGLAALASLSLDSGAASSAEISPLSASTASVASASAASAAPATPVGGTIIILRGLPGSGKTRKANELRIDAQREGKTCRIHCTDDFFTSNGQYKFDGTKLQEYHDKNFRAFLDSVDKRIQVIIIDNTNLKKSDYSRYKADGYTVKEIVIGKFDAESARTYARRCTHSVPLAAITKMASNFEK